LRPCRLGKGEQHSSDGGGSSTTRHDRLKFFFFFFPSFFFSFLFFADYSKVETRTKTMTASLPSSRKAVSKKPHNRHRLLFAQIPSSFLPSGWMKRKEED
jgi:hypothetical protein